MTETFVSVKLIWKCSYPEFLGSAVRQWFRYT